MSCTPLLELCDAAVLLFPNKNCSICCNSFGKDVWGTVGVCADIVGFTIGSTLVLSLNVVSGKLIPVVVVVDIPGNKPEVSDDGEDVKFFCAIFT